MGKRSKYSSKRTFTQHFLSVDFGDDSGFLEQKVSVVSSCGVISNVDYRVIANVGYRLISNLDYRVRVISNLDTVSFPFWIAVSV